MEQKQRSFPLFLGVFFVIGAWLRLWNLGTQVFLDDEWHALNFVLDRSFFQSVFEQGMGANSIPVNIHTWFVLHTTGWSEIMLKLPSILAGLAAMIVIPLLTARLWGRQVATVTAALLAVSPVVIFYSRVARPYSPTMLLAASSVLLTLLWMKEGKSRDLVLSAITGALAIFYHLYAAIPVGLPLCVAFAAAISGKRFNAHYPFATPYRDMIACSLIMLTILVPFAVIPNIINPWWASGAIHNMDRANLETFLTVLAHLAGTDWLILKLTAFLLFIYGFFVIFRESPIHGTALAIPFCLFAVIMGMTTQDGSHAGIQVSRYGISFYPVAFLVMAKGIVSLHGSLSGRIQLFAGPAVSAAAGVILWLPFLATSPLRTIYDFPNNFTNHSGYQYKYKQINWNRSPERDLVPGISMRRENIPPLYSNNDLLKSAQGIIEYPMMIGDHINIYFYYQHFHRKPVAIGFMTSGRFGRAPNNGNWVYASDTVDYVMSSLPEELKLKQNWNAMVNISDISSLRDKFRGWMLIIHRNPQTEIFRQAGQANDISPLHPLAPDAARILSSNFGMPSHMDSETAAWIIR